MNKLISLPSALRRTLVEDAFAKRAFSSCIQLQASGHENPLVSHCHWLLQYSFYLI